MDHHLKTLVRLLSISAQILTLHIHAGSCGYYIMNHFIFIQVWRIDLIAKLYM